MRDIWCVCLQNKDDNGIRPVATYNKLELAESHVRDAVQQAIETPNYEKTDWAEQPAARLRIRKLTVLSKRK